MIWFRGTIRSKIKRATSKIQLLGLQWDLWIQISPICTCKLLYDIAGCKEQNIQALYWELRLGVPWWNSHIFQECKRALTIYHSGVGYPEGTKTSIQDCTSSTLIRFQLNIWSISYQQTLSRLNPKRFKQPVTGRAPGMLVRCDDFGLVRLLHKLQSGLLQESVAPLRGFKALYHSF